MPPKILTMKEKYIIERPSKHGLTYQIKIRQGSASFSQTIRVADFPSKKTAFEYAKRIRDQQLLYMRTMNQFKNASEMPTIKQLYDRKWELSGLSIKTKKKQDAIFKAMLQDYADVKIDKIRASDIQQTLVTYAETHTEGQLNRAKTIWRQLYQTANLLGYDVIDLTPRISPIHSKIPTAHKSTTTDAETFRKFMETLLEYKDKKQASDISYMLQIMYHTGCRIGEALAISASDYDPQAKTLHIQKAVGSTATATRVIITTKTRQSNRIIPLNSEACSLLDDLIAKSKTDPLLTDHDGKPYDVSKLSDIISGVSKKAGVSFNAYRLRHLFSTDLFRSGESPAVIRDLMGHTSRTMSLDYATSSAEEKMEAIEKLSGQTRDKKVSQ